MICFISSRTQLHVITRKSAQSTSFNENKLTIVIYDSISSSTISPVNNVILSSLKAGFKEDSAIIIGEGEDEKWQEILEETGNIAYGLKLDKVKTLLKTMKPQQKILLIDGRDTLIQLHPDEIVNRYQKIIEENNADEHNSIVFSAESSCCVAPMWKSPPG